MDTKNTIITNNDISLLEEVIARYGRIVTFVQLYEILKLKHSLAEARNRVARLAKMGWLIRLKKGLYLVITDIASLSSEDVSLFSISQAFNKNSYISFENALAYHGMFDQMLSTVGAVTFARARSYKVKSTEFRFFKIKNSLYFGFSEERSDIGIVNIAGKEKALLDMLYFRSNAYYAGLVWEKLQEYKKTIDFTLLKKYTEKFSDDVIRQIGFFLDRLDIGTDDLSRVIHGKRSYSRMTKGAKVFDAKWRLFFENSIIG